MKKNWHGKVNYTMFGCIALQFAIHRVKNAQLQGKVEKLRSLSNQLQLKYMFWFNWSSPKTRGHFFSSPGILTNIALQTIPCFSNLSVNPILSLKVEKIFFPQSTPSQNNPILSLHTSDPALGLEIPRRSAGAGVSLAECRIRDESEGHRSTSVDT